jgi:ketosteroid isomerase-like protein
MRNLEPKRLAGIFIVLAASSILNFAQTSVPQGDASGKWSGSFDITLPDGSVKNDTAWFDFKQAGTVLAGTAGPNETQQSEIKDGKVNGQEVQFTIERQGGKVLIFNLHRDGDDMKGEANGELSEGKVKVQVHVTRLHDQTQDKPPASRDLYDQISHMDTVLFDAYNARDLATLETLFTPDLEFYHDRGGLTFYQQNMDLFKATFASDTTVRRALVEGSLEVYPIKGYGAVEIGVHRFYSTEKGQPEKLTATAKFVHIWRKTDDGWKISRVISYDHR